MAFSKSEKKEIEEIIKAVMSKTVQGHEAFGEVKTWGENVKCLELKCGLKIALEDYWEIDKNGEKKIEFTQEEAIAIEEKTNGRWRVPTMVEWAQIVEELGTKDGMVDRDTLVKTLNLTEDEDGWGHYWSSTVQSSSYGYGLGFYSGGLGPADQLNRYLGWSVRCVAR